MVRGLGTNQREPSQPVPYAPERRVHRGEPQPRVLPSRTYECGSRVDAHSNLGSATEVNLAASACALSPKTADKVPTVKLNREFIFRHRTGSRWSLKR